MTKELMQRDQMLSLRVMYLENSICIAVRGEVDMSTAPELLERVQIAFEQRPRSVVLDIADLEYIDSVGLGILVTAYKRAQAAGIEFALSAPSPRVLRLLELTGLKDVFEGGESGLVQ